jgi:type IV pilus assembly protein PilB
MKKRRLGEILLFKGVIDEEQMEKAIELQKEYQKENKFQRFGDCLIDGGFITDEDLAQALNLQLGIEYIDLRGFKLPPEMVSLINGSILRKHNVVPVGFDERNPSVLVLAMSDPLDMVAQDDISIITSCMIDPRVTTKGAINAILDRYFGSDEAMTAAEQYSKEREIQLQQLAEQTSENEQEATASAPIIQMVKSIIEQAVRQRASDIHIDALEKKIRVRYRIDGVLAEKMVYDLTLLSAIISRIKIISGMDISEKRKPQDGRMTQLVDRTEFDIRVSVLPTFYGEKVVMRLASSAGFNRKKTELGMREAEMTKFNHIISNPNGVFLVTGPTGSGKSTTLYTAISELNKEGVNIITVEDPVEANISGVNQVHVNVKAEMTFANALRSILRQDPDIIMIGEIRDRETASIAVQASITGHLVVSTLHTNSSAATVTRLLDMGIESFLLADALVGIIAQRLVRRLCPQCKKPKTATAFEKQTLGLENDPRDITIYEPGKCHICSEVGYQGRIGVYEIMEITPTLKSAIANSLPTEKIRDTAVEEGMSTLRMSAAQYVLDGVTSMSEMLKVSFEQ